MNKLLLLASSCAALLTLGCGSGSSESSLRDTATPPAVGSTQFYGPMAEKLLNAIKAYPGHFTTQNGVGLAGVNTTVTCTFDAKCAFQGPSIQNGALEVDLGQIAAGQNPKPIQQQLYEALDAVHDDGVGATGISNWRICQNVDAQGRCNGEDIGDWLSVSQSWDFFDPNAIHYYSVRMKLVPAETPAPLGSTTFYGPMAVKLLKAIQASPDRFATQAGVGLSDGAGTVVSCTLDAKCALQAPGIVNGALDVALPEVAASVGQKSVQQQVFEALSVVNDGGSGATGISTWRLCQIVDNEGQCNAQIPGDLLRASERWDFFTPNAVHYFSLKLHLIQG